MSCMPCGCDPGANDHRCETHRKWPTWGQKAEPELRPALRQFETGATRDIDHDKYDYEGFLSPLVLERYAAYMHKNRIQKDGSTRDSDNWQRGIPATAYMKSGYRHFMDWWRLHRGPDNHHGDLFGDRMEEALCALLFNVMGYLHEFLKGQRK